MKRITRFLCAIMTIAVVALFSSCGTDEIVTPAAQTSSQPMTFEEMYSFRSMDYSAIVAMLEEKGYSSVYETHYFYKGTEEVSFEYNDYELLSVCYACREEGALSSGKMKRLFVDALDDAKAFCENYTLDSTSFYAWVNEERIPDVHTEEELLAFIDNCDRSVMNDGYARFYCQGFTLSIHFIGDNLDKRIEWDPTPRYTFNGTTWEFSNVSVGSGSGGSMIDLGNGLKLIIRDKIEFNNESTGAYTYNRTISDYINQTLINKDSIVLPFTYSTEMLYDNEYFTAHISQLENIGITEFTYRVDSHLGYTHVYMPELGEEATLLFRGSLNTIDAR